MSNDRDRDFGASETSGKTVVRRRFARREMVLLVIALLLGAAWLVVFILNRAAGSAESLPDATGFPTHGNLARLIRRDVESVDVNAGFRESQTTASEEWVIQEFQTATRQISETRALLERFMQAVLDDLKMRGCHVDVIAGIGPWAGYPMFTIRYSRGSISGGIQVNSFADSIGGITISCYAYEHLR